MSKQQSGFTLIELVVVIVILGLLAATALPRFVNLTSSARTANLNGLAGGLNSAASLARAQYLVTGSNSATSVMMDNTSITVLPETGNTGMGGIPTANAAGVVAAAQLNTAVPGDYNLIGGGTTASSTLTIQPQSGGSANCQVTYTPGNSPRVVVMANNC